MHVWVSAEKCRVYRIPFRPLPLSDLPIVTFICYIARDPIDLPWRNTTQLQKAVNLIWLFFFGWNEVFGGIVLAVWKIGTQDAPATPLGRLTLVSAPTAVRLRVVGLPALIKSAVKATGWWRFVCMPWQGRGSHGTGPESRLRHGSFLRHEKWHY